MKKLPIFFSFDEGYVTPAAVTFESLLTSARPDVFYELYVLHEGIHVASQRLLSELVTRHGNARLHFIGVAGILEGAGVFFDDKHFCVGQDKSKFTKETLLRCLPMLVPEFDQYDRILYSDVDICVVDDIADLFETDLAGAYLAGCRIPAFLDEQTAHFPENLRASYVAGGIWLMNLRQMREDALGERILELMRVPPFRFIWNDQDVMNLACQGKVAFISYRYCSIPLWRSLLGPIDYADERYPNDELRDAMYRPKIIHYAYAKPWKQDCESDGIWHYWHRRTGFPSIGKGGRRLTGVAIYLLRFIKVPDFLVRTYFRHGDMNVRVCEFLIRMKIKKVSAE